MLGRGPGTPERRARVADDAVASSSSTTTSILGSASDRRREQAKSSPGVETTTFQLLSTLEHATYFFSNRVKHFFFLSTYACFRDQKLIKIFNESWRAFNWLFLCAWVLFQDLLITFFLIFEKLILGKHDTSVVWDEWLLVVEWMIKKMSSK